MAKTAKKKGFAGMAKTKALAIQRKGGQIVQALGLGHQWTRDEALAAAKKAGELSRLRAEARRRSFLPVEPRADDARLPSWLR